MFLRLIRTYEPALRRLSAAYVAEQAQQEDLFQEAALALWQVVPRFRGEASGRTWLCRIAHNVAISAQLKLRKRRQRETSIDHADQRAFTLPRPEDQLEATERRRLMLETIRELPSVDRQLIVLHLEGLAHAEIAEVSGLSQPAIATRLTPGSPQAQSGPRDSGGVPMNRPQEDLQQFWRNQPSRPRGKEEQEMLEQNILRYVEGKGNDFDREIRRRNWLEYIAAAGVGLTFAAFLGISIWRTGLWGMPMLKAGLALAVAASIWVVFYLRRHGGAVAAEIPELTLATYRKVLMEKYDRQIRLLRNVKFWYLLPLYAALMTISAWRISVEWERARLDWTDFRYPASVTILYIFIWWLNERWTVSKLKKERSELLVLLGKEGEESG